MRDASRKAGGGTGRIGRSESASVEGDEGGEEAWDEAGSTGMKEKEVGVASDCNNKVLQERMCKEWWNLQIVDIISLVVDRCTI